MAFGDEDLAYMLGDVMSVPVVYGNQSTGGILDDAAETSTGGFGQESQVRRRVLHIATGSLVDLIEDEPIRVAGLNYRVRLMSPLDDGRITAILLAEA